MAEKVERNIKFTDGVKIFIAAIFLVLVACLAIIFFPLLGDSNKKPVNNTSTAPHWEYKTVSVEREGECDFSKMLDDKWQLTGIQIKKYETNLKFRRTAN